MPPRRSTGRLPKTAPHAWGLELHTERSGLFFYRYRRLRIERRGRRAAINEFLFRLDYDVDAYLTTKPGRIVRRRGRSLSPEETTELWRRLAALWGRGVGEVYPCLDDTDPASLDPSVGPDGRPISVLTGEEGPACMTLRIDPPRRRGAKEPARPRLERILIDRYRTPGEAPASRGAPLTRLLQAVDPGLEGARPFNYRRSRTLPDLSEEYAALKAQDFLNLGGFERRFVEALGWVGDAGAVPLLTAELFASDPAVRLEALDALAAIGDRAAVSDVELLAYDDDPEVRERAREALERLQDRVEDCV